MLTINPITFVAQPEVFLLLLIGIAMLIILAIVKSKQKHVKSATTISNSSFADGYFGLLYAATEKEPQKVVIFNSEGRPLNTIYATDEQRMLGLTTKNGNLCLYTSEIAAGIEKNAKWVYNPQTQAFEPHE
jgi:hypothetical protein